MEISVEIKILKNYFLEYFHAEQKTYYLKILCDFVDNDTKN